MNKDKHSDKQEFYDEIVDNALEEWYSAEAATMAKAEEVGEPRYKFEATEIVLKDILWQWIESKKQQWQREARLIGFHDGYQTRCDEDEVLEKPTLTEKAKNAIKYRSEIYQEIIKKGMKI